MNKSYVVGRILEAFESRSLNKNEIKELYDSFINVIAQCLSDHGLVRLQGVGSLYTIECMPKKYRDIRSGKVVVLPKKKRVKFRPSKSLLASVNL